MAVVVGSLLMACKGGNGVSAIPPPGYVPPYDTAFALARLLDSECARVLGEASVQLPRLRRYQSPEGPVVLLDFEVVLGPSPLGVTYFDDQTAELVAETGEVKDPAECATRLAATVEHLKRVIQAAESTDKVKRFVQECVPGTVRGWLHLHRELYYVGKNADAMYKYLVVDKIPE